VGKVKRRERKRDREWDRKKWDEKKEGEGEKVQWWVVKPSFFALQNFSIARCVRVVYG